MSTSVDDQDNTNLHVFLYNPHVVITWCIAIAILYLTLECFDSNDTKKKRQKIFHMYWGGIMFLFNVLYLILAIIIPQKHVTYMPLIFIGCVAIFFYVPYFWRYVFLNTIPPFKHDILGIRSREMTATQLIAEDKYQDFTTSLGEAVVVGFSQALLILMYIWAAMGKGGAELPVWDSVDTEKGHIDAATYFVLGMYVQIGYSFSRNYRENRIKQWIFWNRANDWMKNEVRWELQETQTQQHGDNDEHNDDYVIPKFDFYVRFYLSMAMNGVGFLAIFFLVPAQLASSSDPLDFVLNSVAAYFIIEMDDLSNGKTLKAVQNHRPEHPQQPIDNPVILSIDQVVHPDDPLARESQEDSVDSANSSIENVICPIS